MNRKIVSLLLLCLAMVALVWQVTRVQETAASAWTQKVDQWVLDKTADGGEAEFLVFLKEQADVSGAYALKTKEEKGQYVYEQLTAVAASTQPALTSVLDNLGVEYQTFWVANMIRVKGDANVLQTMAQHPDVAHIYANPSVQMPPLPEVEEEEMIRQALTVEWNIALVNADDVWAEGYTGQGVVIGAQDTGYDWDHPALINHYRGWNGSIADHNYNWHDSIHANNPNTPAGNPCGFDIIVPCDDNGHGTHTMGTMVGDDGGSNQIGMAPGAEWISCRNMEEGWGMPSTYSECYQWFIAPTDLTNSNPNPAMAPHVIGNSWGCPATEGCTDPNVMLTVVQNVRAAGIVTVHSAGNDGPGCSTVNTPAGIYDESYSVAATNSSDVVAGFSSRGPVTVDGSNRPKPDISAPGVNVRSSLPGTGYGSLSGTSMASPHVTGMVALLISIDPNLAGNVDLIEQIISQTAVPRYAAACGSSGTDIPNNTYGYGRIDVLAAYNAMAIHTIDLQKVVSTDLAAPGDLLTYTLTITHSHLLTGTTNVILTDTIPANTTFVTATMPHTLNGDVVSWHLPSMAANASYEAYLVVQVAEAATGTIVNDDYGVMSDDVAFTTGAPVSTEVEPFALAIHKSASETAVTSGDYLTYTLTVTNLNTLAATTNVLLTDTIPVSTTFVSASGTYTLTGDTIEWATASLEASGVWTVELVVQVDLPEGEIENVLYGVESGQVSAVSGPAVITTVNPAPITQYFLYLPAIIQP